MDPMLQHYIPYFLWVVNRSSGVLLYGLIINIGDLCVRQVWFLESGAPEWTGGGVWVSLEGLPHQQSAPMAPTPLHHRCATPSDVGHWTTCRWGVPTPAPPSAHVP